MESHTEQTTLIIKWRKSCAIALDGCHSAAHTNVCTYRRLCLACVDNFTGFQRAIICFVIMISDDEWSNGICNGEQANSFVHGTEWPVAQNSVTRAKGVRGQGLWGKCERDCEVSPPTCPWRSFGRVTGHYSKERNFLGGDSDGTFRLWWGPQKWKSLTEVVLECAVKNRSPG